MKNLRLIDYCRSIGRDPTEIARSMQAIVRADDPGEPANARLLVAEMIEAGVTHIVLAPVLAGRPLQWLVDEVVEPVLAQLHG
jgi:hypothetical protein